ncbi:glycoside hydrolase family 88 protein [Kribbella qitaiheensis]|uniref:glycoside hydrolase family 88 protein n=1 Tax=Kribbella qitaiheensis TaxID=1544730 RepID=UPI0019D6807E|nr:glycoside hydrolase family 88 protein [Kribbella qitaiheensis]
MTDDRRYLDYTRSWAEKHAYGIPGGVTTRHANNHHCTTTPSGPVACGSRRAGLWYCDDRFLPGKIVSPNGKPVLWSRGNGWVGAAHVKTLKALPANQQNVAEYSSTLTQLVTVLRPIQRSDGFWTVNLGDPQHLPGPETSGTAFFTYATAYAIKAGLVAATSYQAVAARAWNGMVATAVHPGGFLGYVQKVGDGPESSQPITYDSTADFGVGACLRAGSELAGLAG